MRNTKDLSVDILFVALTRPATMWGIPYMAFIIEFMLVTLVFLATGNFFYLLIIVPLHGILYLVSAHDPAIFDSLYVWSKTTGRCRNSRFWGAASFSPLSMRRSDL